MGRYPSKISGDDRFGATDETYVNSRCALRTISSGAIDKTPAHSSLQPCQDFGDSSLRTRGLVPMSRVIYT